MRFSPRFLRFLEISSGFPKEIKALFRESISGMVILYRKYTLISRQLEIISLKLRYFHENYIFLDSVKKNDKVE